MSSYTLTLVDTSSNEFELVAEHAAKSSPQECIICIERITNPTVQAAYDARKEELIHKVGKDKVYEEEVFHGARNATSYEAILQHGFKASYAKVCAYGMGVYFASAYQMSKSYSSKEANSEYFSMLVCKIMYTDKIIGSSNQHMQEKDKEAGAIFVSHRDNKDITKESHIYSCPTDSQMIPVYLVQFYNPNLSSYTLTSTKRITRPRKLKY
jgi:hypothetical protein